MPICVGYFLVLQSGQGHWSHPHPVHASRIMERLYPRYGNCSRTG
jgi:hypothetical protein